MMRITALGSFPGHSMTGVLPMVLEQLPDNAVVPELPARGVGAGMIGRSLAMADGLAFDLQPAGWRLAQHPSAELRSARALLRRDLDDLEEAIQGWSGVLRLSVAGPLTLASWVEHPRGDKVLRDGGARTELAQALGAGVGQLLAEMQQRMPGVQLGVQLDEPNAPAVMGGVISTASGLHTHRSLNLPEASRLLGWVSGPLSGVVEDQTLHCCARGLDLDLPGSVGINTVAVDIDQVDATQLDALAAWWDHGRSVWLGVAPTAVPDALPGADRLAERALRLLRASGLGADLLLDRTGLTPACGLAGWSAPAVPKLLTQLQQAAGIVAEELPR